MFRHINSYMKLLFEIFLLNKSNNKNNNINLETQIILFILIENLLRS